MEPFLPDPHLFLTVHNARWRHVGSGSAMVRGGEPSGHLARRLGNRLRQFSLRLRRKMPTAATTEAGGLRTEDERLPHGGA